MPYKTVAGNFELASRNGHGDAVLGIMSDSQKFHVPVEKVPDRKDLRGRVHTRESLGRPSEPERLESVIAIDGSRMGVRAKDGFPSVVYGYGKAAAIYLDLTAVESQRRSKFVDPTELTKAVSTSLLSFDLPCAGAYEREGISIQQSWREGIDRIMRKRVEANNINRTLLDLLMLLHGAPGRPATSVPVNCPHEGCDVKDTPVPASASAPAGQPCPECGRSLFTTDVLRIQEEVAEDGPNELALNRLMSVSELLLLVGLGMLLWDQNRHDLLPSTLLLIDGPLAIHGPTAKLRGRALDFFQQMAASTPGNGPHVVGIEKTGMTVDYARAMSNSGILSPGDLLEVDSYILSRSRNTRNTVGYGKETYWGRKFIYQTLDGSVLVPTVMPPVGPPYDERGGQPSPDAYPTLPAVLDALDRTGSSMYRDGLIPVSLAHGQAAIPIGVGTDVLTSAAQYKLGLGPGPAPAS